jgi:hypothetical protein
MAVQYMYTSYKDELYLYLTEVKDVQVTLRGALVWRQRVSVPTKD